MDTYVYYIGKKIYINLTNRCSNACDFCIRKGRDGMANQPLWIEKEPTAQDVIKQLPSNMDDYDTEVVFCGFGEPTYNMSALCEVAEFLHCVGKTVRINTNGQGRLINGRDIVEDLIDTVDVVNVSLNMATRSSYDKVCHSQFKEKAFDELLDFAVCCRKACIDTLFSVVDCIGKEEIDKAQKLADSYHIRLRVRKYE